MANIQKNIICLDGSDWHLNWFVTNDEVIKNKSTRHIRNQEMDSGESAGVFDPEYSAAGWMRGTVPGCARSFLIENNEMPDPYFGRNCEQSIWVEGKSWWFRKEFEVPAAWLKRKFILKFLGLDYACDIYLNGQLIADHIGMFLQRELDVTGIIQPGRKNVLVLGFQPAPKAEPHHSLNETVTEFARHHRCQMSWGWDWSRHLVPTGIWDSVYLESYDELRINDLWCRWQDGNLEVELDILCSKAGEYKFNLDVSPDNFTGAGYKKDLTETLQSGEQKIKFSLEIEQPALWYPNGAGPQNLYKVSVKTQDAAKQQLFGFRRIEMLPNKSAEKDAYPLTFCVNGTRIFARGANWVPADLMPSRLAYADYERLVRLAAEAGMNILRIWGGGLIEKDAFYECCDRYGIMVWQEFPHSCSKYPQDEEYLKFKKLEAVGIIKRLRNHPALALWCGGNEMQYYGEKPDSPLLEQYRQLTEKYCPELAYHVTSPDFSRPGERPHGPWTFMEHDFYNEHKRLLASEIGCPGMSEIESVRKFIPENEPWPDGPSFKYHFLITHSHHSLMNFLDDFELNSLDELCQASQMAQADSLGYIMEHYRCMWPVASGCFIWQYNEPWPTLAWSLVDWHSHPKAAYYRLKKSCAPVMLRLKDAGWNIKDGKFKAELWGINDVYSSTEDLEVSFSLMSASGKVIVEDVFNAPMQLGSPQKLRSYNEAISIEGEDIIFAFMRLRTKGRTIFSAERFYGCNGFRKLFKMSRADIQVRQMDIERKHGETQLVFTLKNSGSAVAAGIHLSLPYLPVKALFWSDNYFSLLPGEQKEIVVKIASDVTAPKLRIKAWNIPEFIAKYSGKVSKTQNKSISEKEIRVPALI